MKIEKILTSSEDVVIIIKYDNFKRLLMVLVYCLVCLLGLSLCLIGNWFTIIFGSLILIVGVFKMIDILFFKVLSIDENYLIKEWYLFGNRTVLLKDLKANVSKKKWSGTLFFQSRDSSFFERIIMSFEILPIGNDKFNEIKNILINKKIINGDEHEWNTSN